LRSLQRAGAIGLAAAASVAVLAAPAHAESAPGCSGTTQIGSTAYVTVGSSTYASVKQFKGCGKNWAYTYVWASYRKAHSHWEACASIAKMASSTSTNGSLMDLNCDYSNPVEVWSFGANTLANCTQAVGWYPDVATAHTDTRC
jgi:hypothetical protein